MEIFFIISSILYLLIHLILYSGLLRSINLKKNENKILPAISVIVAGRNEEKNIVRCINSLAKLKYPPDLLEIILVNDNSTDSTYDLMLNSTKEHKQFKVINSVKSSNGNLKGKANAIDNAISICKGELIISTDADCEVNPDWALNTVKYYLGNTGMVCGFTIIENDSSIFAKLQCIDWVYLLTLASSSAGLKMILSCIGNNLSFSKNAYNSVGGYSSIEFSVTEDLALMRKINSDKKFIILFPVDKSCLVTTLPCKSLSELFSQKRRWFRGGTGINFLGYIVGALLFAMNILLVLGLFFLSIKLYLALVLLKLISEFILLHKVFREFEIQSYYKYYFIFSFYFAFVGLMLPISFLSGKEINWKGRKF
ncbi:MAG TPA: glycosyltransferase [Ignavibacteria bacterium]|nr:glycosyltransferase [Ignavibacteria bacterium]